VNDRFATFNKTTESMLAGCSKSRLMVNLMVNATTCRTNTNEIQQFNSTSLQIVGSSQSSLASPIQTFQSGDKPFLFHSSFFHSLSNNSHHPILVCLFVNCFAVSNPLIQLTVSGILQFK
jgi:hypothetical protein